MKKVVLFALLFALPLMAQDGVVDGGSFFSASAKQQAESQIARMRQQTGYGCLIETFAKVPDDMQARFQAQGKDKFFATWLSERVVALKVTGFYVLICKNPGYLRVGTPASVEAMGVTGADRDSMTAALLANFRSKQYDAGLQKVVADGNNLLTRLRVAQAPAPYIPPAQAQPAPADEHSAGYYVLLTFCIILGIGLLIMIAYKLLKKTESESSSDYSSYSDTSYSRTVTPTADSYSRTVVPSPSVPAPQPTIIVTPAPIAPVAPVVIIEQAPIFTPAPDIVIVQTPHHRHHTTPTYVPEPEPYVAPERAPEPETDSSGGDFGSSDSTPSDSGGGSFDTSSDSSSDSSSSDSGSTDSSGGDF